MSNDRTSQEFHLTQKGWVAGTFSVYASKEEMIALPPDRVETWLEDIEDTSGWAPEAVEWTRIWQSQDFSAETLANLHKKYPQPRHKPRPAIPKKKRQPLSDYM